ncbi:hypothetical protein HanRHA438_Chr09g0373571 [Helianthus annuus]|nr:hypothetical protein HanRHA438_Chr09g0373571 [Helianthus annuus]
MQFPIIRSSGSNRFQERLTSFVGEPSKIDYLRLLGLISKTSIMGKRSVNFVETMRSRRVIYSRYAKLWLWYGTR